MKSAPETKTHTGLHYFIFDKKCIYLFILQWNSESSSIITEITTTKNEPKKKWEEENGCNPSPTRLIQHNELSFAFFTHFALNYLQELFTSADNESLLCLGGKTSAYEQWCGNNEHKAALQKEVEF
ncbi:hypothetical protein NL108_018343 [Boleophthalmus pectinirostris]|nr:hypothetical protein NL108_018343 [Boleophthalmus pectinirostris]